MHPRRPLLLAGLLSVAAACGARTGLFVPTGDAGGGPLPPVHAAPVAPSQLSGCADAGSTVIYVVTEQDSLLSFDPPTATFTRIGTLACPGTISAEPFSMAVDRAGVAYVLYQDAFGNNGGLFRVNTATAACEATAFVPDRAFAQTFGMGFSTNPADGGEELYVAADQDAGSRLATLDTTTFALRVVGAFDPPITSPELTGTGGGDLFAFYATGFMGSAGSAIAQINPSTARSIGQSPLASVHQNTNWAFAIWGGDFYTFTGTVPGVMGRTTVTRFRPSDGSIVTVAELPDTIVGAGVSTCAPQP